MRHKIFNFTLCCLYCCLQSAGMAAVLEFKPTLSLTAGIPGDLPDTTRVAYNSKHDEYLIVYQVSNFILTGGKQQIHAARLSSEGSYIANYVISDLPNNCIQPDVAYDPLLDRYLIVWTYDTDGLNYHSLDIYGRFVPWCGPVDTLPSFEVARFMNDVSGGSGWHMDEEEKYPRIAYSPTNKDFVVVMVVDERSAEPYIAGKRIKADGSEKWNNLLIRPNNTTSFTNPDIVYNGIRDEFMIVYDNTESIYSVTIPGQQAVNTFEKNPAGIQRISMRTPTISLSGIHERPAISFSEEAKYYLISWVTNRHIDSGDLNVRYYPGGNTIPDNVVFREILDTANMNVQNISDVSCKKNGSDCLVTWIILHEDRYYTFGRQITLESNSSGTLTNHTTGFMGPLDNISSPTVWGEMTPFVGVAAGLKNYCLGFTGLDSFAIKHAYNRVTDFTASTGWASVAAGNYHSIAIQADGSLWAWGHNVDGQLGVGMEKEKSFVPIRVGKENDWVSVAAGYAHSFGIRSDGSLWAWGNNMSGQLGIGNTELTFIPVPVQPGTKWTAISAGFMHTLGIMADGSLWGWGGNFDSQLGLGNIIGNRDIPNRIEANSVWSAIATGNTHSLGIRSDRTLWAWGGNDNGQLGHGDISRKNQPTRVGVLRGWTSIAGGSNYSLGIIGGSSLWAWGGNIVGQLGVGDLLDRLQPELVGFGFSTVVAAESHSLGITGIATANAWGLNSFGQLGLGDSGVTTCREIPTRIEFGSYWMTVAGGGWSSLGILSDGTLWAWGYNSHGQLGLGDTKNRNYPEKVEIAKKPFSWNLFLPAIIGRQSH